MAIVVPVILLALLVSFSFLVLPISPTLKATFKITTPNPYTAPTFEVVDATYNKVSLLASATSTKGNITVSYLGAKPGSYMLFIAVSYGDTTLSTGTYTSLGDGLYQIYVAYLPRLGEQSTVPYIVSFSLFYSNGQKITDFRITVYPT